MIEYYIVEFSFCKGVQFPNAPLQSPELVLHCSEEKKLWYRVGKCGMSSVWNKVDEYEQNITYELVTIAELQILDVLSYKYEKVNLIEFVKFKTALSQNFVPGSFYSGCSHFYLTT